MQHERPEFLLQFSDHATHIWDFLVLNNDELFTGTARSNLLTKQLEVLVEEFMKQEDYDYSNVVTFATMLYDWNAEGGNRYDKTNDVSTFIVKEVEDSRADRYPEGSYE